MSVPVNLQEHFTQCDRAIQNSSKRRSASNPDHGSSGYSADLCRLQRSQWTHLKTEHSLRPFVVDSRYRCHHAIKDNHTIEHHDQQLHAGKIALLHLLDQSMLLRCHTSTELRLPPETSLSRRAATLHVLHRMSERIPCMDSMV